jgi:hypothetical protein
METEIIDKLFLELSQISKAKTKREIDLIFMLSDVLDAWKTEANWGDGIDESHIRIYNRAMKLINPNYEP